MRILNLVAALASVALIACGLGQPAFALSTSGPGLGVSGTLAGTLTNTNPIGTSAETINATFGNEQFTGGTGSAQIDTFYATQLTIAASGSTTIALNGSVTDAFGNTVNLLHVKLILLLASAANTNDCVVSPGATNPFNGPWSGTTPAQAVSPGETLLMTKGAGAQVGWPVVASTGMNLKVANSSSGTSVVCTLYIAGTST